MALTKTLAVVCGGVLLGASAVGCGPRGSSSAPESTPGTASSAAATSATAAPVQDDPDKSGRMIVTFEKATTPEARRGWDLMQKTGLLEDLADGVTESFRLPFDVPLVGAQCDEANDFWDPTDKKMVMCYEDVDLSLELFSDSGDPDPEAAAEGIAVASFYHELGHMLIDLYDLPVTGREEDVADQLSAFMLLAPDGDGTVNQDDVQAARDMAGVYERFAQSNDQLEKEAFADVHTMDQSRSYNFECWIYGSDPDGNADLVSSGKLPEDRADGCVDEYDKLARAWSDLLTPHLK